MKILILSALQSEIDSLITLYKPLIIMEGKKHLLLEKNIEKHTLYFGITGVGEKNVRRFFKAYSPLNIKADLVISTGYAGAINESLKVGDIVIADKILCNKTGEWHTVDATEMFGMFHFDCSERSRPFTTWNGQIVKLYQKACTVNKILLRDEKKQLKEKYNQIDFIDMESVEIATFCKNNKLNFIIIRSISDTVNFEFPDMEFIKDSWSKINFSRFIPYVFNNPVNLYKIFHLRWNLFSAKKSLARILRKRLKSIYPIKKYRMKF